MVSNEQSLERESYVDKPVVSEPAIFFFVCAQISHNIDGFRQNNSQGF